MTVLALEPVSGFALAGGEKSHAPTPRRRERARQEGKHWKAPDLQGAIALLAAFLVLRWYLPFAGRRLADLESAVYQTVQLHGFALGLASTMVLVLRNLALVVGPLAALLMAVGLGTALAQGGISFRLASLAPDLNRIDPAQGIARMFSVQGLWELLKGVLKLAAIGVLVGLFLRGEVGQLAGVMALSLGGMLAFAQRILSGVLLRAAAAYLVVAVADALYQSRSFQQSLRMSNQEVKDEVKETEGDPRVRGRRREMQRRYARAGLSAVRRATVLVTNPTHFAVALEWDDRVMTAPLVAAKGEDAAAQWMREIALSAEVPVVENPPLARALYAEVPVGQPVPPEHYQVVAEIIAFLLRRRREHRGG